LTSPRPARPSRGAMLEVSLSQVPRPTRRLRHNAECAADRDDREPRPARPRLEAGRAPVAIEDVTPRRYYWHVNLPPSVPKTVSVAMARITCSCPRAPRLRPAVHSGRDDSLQRHPPRPQVSRCESSCGRVVSYFGNGTPCGSASRPMTAPEASSASIDIGFAGTEGHPSQ
jgi:hypothetical protein